MRQLISDTLKESLSLQFGHEVLNSHIYLYIANFLHGKGLSNLAKHFEGQYREEQSHAMTIYKLLTDLGATFDIPSIPQCDMVINSIKDITVAYLDREILTTESLNDLKLLAQEDDVNPVVEERIRQMILDQQHEYEEATDMFDKAESLTEWWQVSLWDLSLGG